MRISNFIRNISLVSVSAAALTFTQPAVTLAQTKDTFIKTSTKSVPPQGTDNVDVLANAPDCRIKIAGEEKLAKIVVDVSTNTLYKYDENGNPERAYLIATGAPRTPTDKGIRMVSHVETYPYRGAPRHTKRRRTPRAFGPKAIIVDKIDPKTGAKSNCGEFIHGNNDASSIGKYASHGCMRMDNEVIKILSTQVKRGDIVIVK